MISSVVFSLASSTNVGENWVGLRLDAGAYKHHGDNLVLSRSGPIATNEMVTVDYRIVSIIHLALGYWKPLSAAVPRPDSRRPGHPGRSVTGNSLLSPAYAALEGRTHACPSKHGSLREDS
jgi:hypothetical protein